MENSIELKNIKVSSLYKIGALFESNKRYKQEFFYKLFAGIKDELDNNYTEGKIFRIGGFFLPTNGKTNVFMIDYNYFLKTLADYVNDDSIISFYRYEKGQGDNAEYMNNMLMFKAIISAGLKMYHVNKIKFNQLLTPMILSAFNDSKILYKMECVTIFPDMLERELDTIIRDIMVLSTQNGITLEGRGFVQTNSRLGKDNYEKVKQGFEI